MAADHEAKKLVNLAECANCCANGEDSNLSKCERCSLVLYCGSFCQKDHWLAGGHSKFCLPVEARSVVAQIDVSIRGCEVAECAICISELTSSPVVTLPCSHVFHVECIDGLRRYAVLQACPTCRANLPVQQPSKVPTPAQPAIKFTVRRIKFVAGPNKGCIYEGWTRRYPSTCVLVACIYIPVSQVGSTKGSRKDLEP